jgi:formyl-CoA transferase
VPGLAEAEGFRTNAERLGSRDAVNAIVADWCAGRTVADAVSALSEHGIVVAPVRTLAQAVADPHVAARGMLQDTVLSNGSSAPLVGPPVKFSRCSRKWPFPPAWRICEAARPEKITPPPIAYLFNIRARNP